MLTFKLSFEKIGFQTKIYLRKRGFLNKMVTLCDLQGPLSSYLIR